jgi:hypothetical protein
MQVGGRFLAGDRARSAAAAGSSARYPWIVSERLRFTISFDEPDEEGWIVARVVEVPGAISQGRTRVEARENVIDALRLMLSPDGDAPSGTDERVELELQAIA